MGAKPKERMKSALEVVAWMEASPVELDMSPEEADQLLEELGTTEANVDLLLSLKEAMKSAGR